MLLPQDMVLILTGLQAGGYKEDLGKPLNGFCFAHGKATTALKRGENET